MYQSSPSTSSSQKSAAPGAGLIRYGSAPGSLLNSAVDAVIGPNHRSFSTVDGSPQQPENFLSHFFSADSSSSQLRSESTCGVSSSDGHKDLGKDILDRSYGFNEISQHRSIDSGSTGSYSLARQRSSPADFFSYLTSDKNGFSMTQGRDQEYGTGGGRRTSRLKTQMSFTGHDSLTRISEVNETAVEESSFGASTDPWDDGSGSIGFTMTRPAKRAKDNSNMDPALFSQFSIPDASLNYMDNFMQLPDDSVPCKIRAKRGFATHPRSIAERERRTRISGKLKKLQDLVPNMDKQTSYSDMLDLAVQHIKGLQQQLLELQQEEENCTCGCRGKPERCGP